MSIVFMLHGGVVGFNNTGNADGGKVIFKPET